MILRRSLEPNAGRGERGLTIRGLKLRGLPLIRGLFNRGLVEGMPAGILAKGEPGRLGLLGRDIPLELDLT